MFQPQASISRPTTADTACLKQLLAAVSYCGKGLQHVALFTNLQAALARGALFTSDVRLWLKLVSTPLVGSLCKLLPAFRSRMLGNPRFLMVLAIEEAIGVAAKWSAEKSSRKDQFWKVCSCKGMFLQIHSPVLSASILASMQNVQSGWLRGQRRMACLSLVIVTFGMAGLFLSISDRVWCHCMMVDPHVCQLGCC